MDLLWPGALGLLLDMPGGRAGFGSSIAGAQ